MKKNITIIAFLMIGSALIAQSIVKESTFQLDKKSAKGYLSVVRIDDDRQEISLVYNTKEKKKKTLFMNYVFDYDLNKISEGTGEEPKFKSKGKKGKNKGDAYEYDEITLVSKGMPGGGGTLTGMVKHVKVKWSNFQGKYLYNRKTITKEKIRSSDDRKLYLRGSVTLDNGNALAFVAPKHKLKDIKTKAGIQLIVLVKPDFTVAKELEFNLVYESNIVGYFVAEEFVYAIYAPIKLMGGPKCKDGSEYTIVKVDINKTEVVSTTKFHSKVGEWNILDIQLSDKGITFVGPGNIKSAGKVKNIATDLTIEKFDAFQLVHMNNQGEVKVAVTSNDEINKNAVIFPTEKKITKYNGKKYDFLGVQQIGEEGDIIVAMQDWKIAKLAAPGTVKFYDVKVYQEMVFLQFSVEGKLKGYYAIPSTAKKEGISDALDVRQFRADFLTLDSGNPNALEILIFQPHHTERLVEYDKDFFSGSSSRTETSTPMYYPRFVQIDFAKKEYSMTVDIGDQKYFLYDKEAVQIINDGTEILFLGESKNDRTLYMARFSIAN
jgi:hypothetical protein